MLRNIYLLLFACSCLVIGSYASLAPFVKPCHPDDDECILSSMQHAIPYLADGISELGIPPGDPMNIKNVTMGQGFSKLVFENMKVIGAKKCKVVDVKRNTEESTIQLTLDCPFVATGRYKMTGRVCFFDVNDEGDFKVKTDSVITTITSKVKKTDGENDKKYWKLDSYEYSWEPAEKYFIELGNLFAGNVAISGPFFDMLNMDWKRIVKEVGNPFASSIVKYFFESVKTFLLHVPIDQLEYNDIVNI